MEITKEDIIELHSDGVERSVSCAGVDISVLEFHPESESDGTIIGIPGGPGLPKEHLLPLAMLTERNYTVVLYDAHNVGESESHSKPYEIETFRSVLTDLISEYESVVLAGHSWGSMLALDLLCTRDISVDGLIAMAPLFDTQDNIRIAETLRADHLSVTDLKAMIQYEREEDYSNKEYEQLSESIYDNFVFIPPIPDFIQERAYERFNTDMYEDMWGPEEFVLSDDGCLKDWSVKSKLHNISTPTLLITGKKDLFGYHDLYIASESITGQTEVTVLDEASHSFFWEQPNDSIDALSSWVSSIDQK